MMASRKGSVALAVLLGMILLPNRSWEQSKDSPGFERVATITLPITTGNAAFDISWVDPATHRYYLADRVAAGIDIVDTTTNKLLGKIGGFVGQDAKGTKYWGPSGVLVIPGLNQAWAGDGDSTIKVVDLQSQKVVDTISTGGALRADELAYDDRDQVIMIGNDFDAPPFLTFISAQPGHKILGRIPLNDATDGLEQPVWDRATGRFYVAVPATKSNPGGEIWVVDPRAMKMTESFPLSQCNPHGLALGPAQHLLIGCRMKALIMNLRNPGEIKEIPQAGGSDEVWFNPGDDKYFLGGTRTGLSIIDAVTNTWIATIPTGQGAHSVAADPVTNQVYVPIQADAKDPACLHGCIAVFADRREQ